MHGQLEPPPPERKTLHSTQGHWWRFDGYEIKDNVIQPAAGAHLERYDPWQAFRDSRVRNDVPSPYEGLLQLQAKLKPTSLHHPGHVTEDSQRLVVDWSQKHGPLGVLLARWEAISLAPRRSETAGFTSTRYLRGVGQNVYECEARGDVGHEKAWVLLHDLNDVELVEKPLGKTWHHFFPSVPRAKAGKYHYPLPYTDEFCHLYAEPLFDFCKAARLFAGAIRHVTLPPSANPGASEQALETINLLRRPVSAVLDRNAGGNLEQDWQTPSLLASFAEMFAQDITFGRATLLCKCCQLPFVSGAYQAKYCSTGCRQRQQKRNVRENAKQARSLRAQGQTIRQIVAALGEDLQLVKGWLAKP